MNLREIFFLKMLLIRRFEERLLDLFSKGLLFGTTHCYIGQEANAVGIIEHLSQKDTIFSNHRCHGHYITFTDDVEGLMAEIMGKKTGLVGGRGGSQHICSGNFFTNGIQGGLLPSAAGAAFFEKHTKTNQIVVAFIGDGTMGQGIVYEILNIIALWKLPLLIVIENNYYAQSTPLNLHLAGNIRARIEAFGINNIEFSTFDVEEIYETSKDIIDYVRNERLPAVIIINTYRFCSHSKSDDYRDPQEIQCWVKQDPIELLGSKINKGTRDQIEAKVLSRINIAERQAINAPFPEVFLDEGLDEKMSIP